MQLNTTDVTPPMPSGGGFMDPNKIVGYLGLTEGMKVADFGSGAGFFTILIAKMIGDSGMVTAVDVMNSALDTLRAKAKMDGLGNIQTVRSNLEILGSSGLANDSQDLVLLINVLFQSSNKEAIINEARRVLRPGGSMVVIGWRKGSGGFGPPENLRTDEEEMKKIVARNDGLLFANEIDAGVFHYGMMFKKA